LPKGTLWEWVAVSNSLALGIFRSDCARWLTCDHVWVEIAPASTVTRAARVRPSSMTIARTKIGSLIPSNPLGREVGPGVISTRAAPTLSAHAAGGSAARLNAISAAMLTVFMNFLLLLTEERQVDRLGHGPIAGIVRMNMVAGVELRLEPGGMSGIARRRVKVDRPVECPARADPLIHLLANRLTFRCVGPHAFPREDRCAHDLETVQMSLLDELAVARDQIIGADVIFGRCPGNGREADVIDAFEENDPVDTRSTEDVAVEARERTRAAPIVQHAIS